MKFTAPVLILLLLGLNTFAQVSPAPGTVLNYTQVMLEYPPVAGATGYLVQVVQDTTGPLFAKPLISQKDNSTATLVTGLDFGKKYLWRYAATSNGKQQPWSGPYGFEITRRQLNNNSPSPLTVVVNDKAKHAGGLIAGDFQCIVDRAGNPVWQMPVVDGEPLTNNTRDLRLTDVGTITFLNSASKPVECDLNGKVLWQAPTTPVVSGDTSEFFHHDFQRLPNGNYMVLGDKYVWKKVPDKYKDKIEVKANPNLPNGAVLPGAPNPFVKTVNGEMMAKLQYGTIIEYNTDGEVVWSWNSETYIDDETMFGLLANVASSLSPAGNGAMPPGVGIASNDRDPHLNAFSVDTAGTYVYAGFRQLSRIIKIEKATGKIAAEWGAQKNGDGFFSNQHGAFIQPNGNILVFDNGGIKPGAQPSRVVSFSQGSNGTGASIKWSADCLVNGTPVKSHRGGNADELANGNILVCSGTAALPGFVPPATPVAGGTKPVKPTGSFPTSHIIEFTPDKQVAWYATVSQQQRAPYRVHYAASLYPLYFTIQAAESTNGNITLTVFNEGSHSDAYTITAISGKSRITASTKTTTVLPDGSVRANLNLIPTENLINGEPVTIVVSSKQQPGLVKSAKVTVAR
jgi:hypothetical protein